MITREESSFSETLKCYWSAWSVAGLNAIRLDLPKGNCVDMVGCIETAENLLPGVTTIYTYADGIPDTIYTRERRGGNGKWEAFMPR